MDPDFPGRDAEFFEPDEPVKRGNPVAYLLLGIIAGFVFAVVAFS
jgi:hypothetical protein